MNAAQHKIVNLLKTFFFAHQFSLEFVYLMCGPRQLFFQCGMETPKGWAPLTKKPFLVSPSLWWLPPPWHSVTPSCGTPVSAFIFAWHLPLRVSVSAPEFPSLQKDPSRGIRAHRDSV